MTGDEAWKVGQRTFYELIFGGNPHMMRHFRLTTLVALFVVMSAVAAAAAPFAYVSQSGTSSVFIVDTGTTPPSAAAGISLAMPAGRMPWGVALSPDGATLFVANFAFTNGSVLAFNTATGALIREVVVGTLPFGVAVNPVNGEVYVTVAANGSKVVAINPSTFVNLGAPPVMSSIPMPSPRGVAVNPAGTVMYVTSYAFDMLHVFNAGGTHDLITTIPMDVSPLGLAVSPDGSKVYVANEDSNTVTIVNTADYSTTSVPVGNGPIGVAVSPDGLEVYVTNSLSGTVSVLDAGGSPIGSEIAVGLHPYGISTDGVYVYTAVLNSNKITAIDRATRAKTDIPALFPIGFGVFVRPAMKIATVMSLALSSESIILGSTAPITATATLQRKNNGAPVADASIMFTVGTSSGTAITGANGAAQWSFSASALGIGSYTVQAVFSESKIGSNVYVGSEASRTFSVRYAFAWIRPTSGSTTGVTAGSTVPVHWSITNANGTAISDLGVVTEITSAPCVSGSSVAAKSARIRASSAGGSDLRYNTDHFMFNWKTDKAWAGSCRQLIVSLNDGSSNSLTFQFR
jgi:YVTN family beta-propeller protein